MTAKIPQIISPREAHDLLKAGAVLVDIREEAERFQVIDGAHHAPMSEIEHSELPLTEQAVVFHCRSGRRTAMNADLLQSRAEPCTAYLMDSGIEGWAAEGLPVANRA